MKKVLFLSVLLVALASSSFAAYMVNWTEGFEGYNLAGLQGQGNPLGWGTWKNVYVSTAYTETDLQVVDSNTIAPHGGYQSAQQRADAWSNSWFDMTKGKWGYGTTGDPAKVGYTSGYAKFWVYEPGTAGGSAQFQAGVYGDGEGIGSNPWTGSVTNSVMGGTIRESVVGGKNYWVAQWNADFKLVDGTVSSSTTNIKWTAYKAAPRRATAGWSWLMVTWNFSAYTGYVEYRFNSTAVNARVDFDSYANAGGGRWKTTTPIVGMMAGQTTSKNVAGRISAIDDVEFHGNLVPEPTSLLALGTGLIGLAGLIRRKR